MALGGVFDPPTQVTIIGNTVQLFPLSILGPLLDLTIVIVINLSLELLNTAWQPPAFDP
jgi:hypothetical protein